MAGAPASVPAVERCLRDRGLPAERLRDSAWWPILTSPAGGGFSAAQVVAEVAAPPRCAICRHPLHRACATAHVTILGRPRSIGGLPHLLPCSCGYADRIIDGAWPQALEQYFRAHPDAPAVEAVDPALLALLASR